MKKIMLLLPLFLYVSTLFAQEETTDSLIVLNQYVTFNYTKSGLTYRGTMPDMISLGLILNKKAKHKSIYSKKAKINPTFYPFNRTKDSYWLSSSFRINNDNIPIIQQKLIFEYTVRNKTYKIDIPLSFFKTKMQIKMQPMKIPEHQRPPTKK